MIKVVASDGQICEVVQKPIEIRWNSEPAKNPSAGLLGLTIGGIIGGLGGYALGKKHGYNDGYNQAKADDNQLLAQYQTQMQNIRRDSAYLQAENNRLSQENGSLHKENQILKDLLLQQPSTPQVEAILKTLGRIELHVTQFLPPLFEDGEDHETQQN